MSKFALGIEQILKQIEYIFYKLKLILGCWLTYDILLNPFTKPGVTKNNFYSSYGFRANCLISTKSKEIQCMTVLYVYCTREVGCQ